MIRACAVQLDPEIGHPERNAERAAAEILEAAREGARLVVLPEAALTGYLFESRDEALAGAVRADGPELGRVAAACRESGAWAVCGAVEREDGAVEREGAPAGDDGPALYNAAFLVSPDGVVGRFRKVHTLCLGVDRFVRPGGEFPVFDTPWGPVGLHICYDGSFPESARALRLAGARLLLLPTNWPRLEVKRELVQVRAYENHVHVLAVNRVGTERGVRFEGGSAAADPFGRLLLHAGAEAGRYHVEMDPEATAGTRVVVSPGEYEYDRLADRRPEAYGSLVRPLEGAGRTGGPSAE